MDGARRRLGAITGLGIAGLARRSGDVFWGQDRLSLLESALKSSREAYRMDATS
jgi:hypothetical protein